MNARQRQRFLLRGREPRRKNSVRRVDRREEARRFFARLAELLPVFLESFAAYLAVRKLAAQKQLVVEPPKEGIEVLRVGPKE